MKKNRFINRILLALALPVLIVGCQDEIGGGGSNGSYFDFATLSSGYYEADGAGTLVVPFRNAGGSAADTEIVLGGTATEGEDYVIEGVSKEGVTINILDDEIFEFPETIRLQIDSKGNSIHTVTIVSNCEDAEDLVSDDYNYFVGHFDATEIYAPDDTYGPYTLELEEDEEVPNKYWMHNFWDSGINAYIVFDPETNTVSFPQQIPDATRPTRIITSVPTVITDGCSFFITTTYRGITWDYEFVREKPI